MAMFQDLVALLAGLLVFGWWLADWVRSGCVLAFIHSICFILNMLYTLDNLSLR